MNTVVMVENQATFLAKPPRHSGYERLRGRRACAQRRSDLYHQLQAVLYAIPVIDTVEEASAMIKRSRILARKPLIPMIDAAGRASD